MNGVKMEIDDPLQLAGSIGLTCCLIDNGIRCHRPTGNASYSKRIAKTVTQRRLKLVVDQTVSCSCMFDFQCFTLCNAFPTFMHSTLYTMARCLVCLSVTRQCSTNTAEWIEVFSTRATISIQHILQCRCLGQLSLLSL